MSDTRGLRFDDVVADGVAHQLADAVQIEFALDIDAVRVHGLYADLQLGGDSFTGQALGDELDNLALARCQARPFPATDGFWMQVIIQQH